MSDGPVGSIVGDWVRKRDNVGGIHHLAYEVQDVEKTMNEYDLEYMSFFLNNFVFFKVLQFYP